MVDEFENKRLKAKIEYGLLITDDGYVIAENKGGKDSVKFNGADLFIADVLTHNHPRGKGEESLLGGTFSEADLNIFADNSLTTMRASASEGVYNISKTSKFNSTEFKKFYRQVDTSRLQEMRNERNQYNSDVRSGKISYAEYIKKWDNAFNKYLINLHNDLLANQNRLGYFYTLERR